LGLSPGDPVGLAISPPPPGVGGASGGFDGVTITSGGGSADVGADGEAGGGIDGVVGVGEADGGVADVGIVGGTSVGGVGAAGGAGGVTTNSSAPMPICHSRRIRAAI